MAALPRSTARERLAFMRTLRDYVIALARLLLACRSSDLTCVCRGCRSAVECVRLDYVDDVLQSIAIRFYRPKERGSLPRSSKGYTRWITVPVILDNGVLRYPGGGVHFAHSRDHADLRRCFHHERSNIGVY